MIMKRTWDRLGFPSVLPSVLLSVLPSVLIVGITCLAFCIAAAGCKTATQRAKGPANVFLDPSFVERDIKSFVFAGVHSGVPDDQAPAIVGDIMTYTLKTQQTRFIVIDPSEAANRAARAGKGEVYRKVRDTWKSHHKVDPAHAKELCEALAVDALLFADISTWEREQVDWTSEGRSFTQVGISIRIVDAEDGRMVWNARDSRLKESEQYEYSDTGLYTEGLSGEDQVARTDRAGSLSPEPPRFEEVSEEVIQVLVAGLNSLERAP
jgi:hypothetical protein